MKESIKIQDMEKWQAVVSCDSKYDGMFLYGVKTTGIFCRPSCKSKTPIRANAIFFDNVKTISMYDKDGDIIIQEVEEKLKKDEDY
jgi:methylphosphotriester-DNA--protein-cysteine methyltransferase